MTAVEFQELSSEEQDLFIDKLSPKEQRQFVGKLRRRKNYCDRRVESLTVIIDKLKQIRQRRFEAGLIGSVDTRE